VERLTLEEATFEKYIALGEKGFSEILNTLPLEMRDIVQRIWGILPYRQHTFREAAQLLGIPLSTLHYRHRQALKLLKESCKDPPKKH